MFKKKKNVCGVYALMNGKPYYKEFTSTALANDYISKSLLSNDYQVYEVIEEGNKIEYYCCDYTRFILMPIA